MADEIVKTAPPAGCFVKLYTVITEAYFPLGLF